MIKTNKRLYFKYFDLFRVSEFYGFEADSLRAQHNMAIIQNNFDVNLVSLHISELQILGFDLQTCYEILEFSSSKDINYITTVLSSVDKWILNLILPDFFSLSLLKHIFISQNIRSKQQLEDYFASSIAATSFGDEQAELYSYFVMNSDNSSFPEKYLSRSYSGLLTEVDGKYLYGNYHNHSTYSDGRLSINELRMLAESYGKSFVGISDHTKRVNGIDEDSVLRQHNEIDALNHSDSSCRILKGVECEILPDGSLDFASNILETFDYVIIAAHRDTNMVKSIATNRLIKAIENPSANILAHPSARLYGKNVGLLLDMHKIIDACVANRVIIEINGDSDRLDLDPKYIDYALDKGAIFSLDSDTHIREGYFNINNSIAIAQDFNIPSSSIINTSPNFNFRSFKNNYV